MLAAEGRRLDGAESSFRYAPLLRTEAVDICLWSLLCEVDILLSGTECEDAFASDVSDTEFETRELRRFFEDPSEEGTLRVSSPATGDFLARAGSVEAPFMESRELSSTDSGGVDGAVDVVEGA